MPGFAWCVKLRATEQTVVESVFPDAGNVVRLNADVLFTARGRAAFGTDSAPIRPRQLPAHPGAMAPVTSYESLAANGICMQRGEE
jgi:hypothetical protein